jgi:hypothetical protein
MTTDRGKFWTVPWDAIPEPREIEHPLLGSSLPAPSRSHFCWEKSKRALPHGPIASMGVGFSELDAFLIETNGTAARTQALA